jgi:hypothetical protein
VSPRRPRGYRRRSSWWPVVARGGAPGWWLTMCGIGGLGAALFGPDGLPGAPGPRGVHVVIALVFVALGVGAWRFDRREARSWWGDRQP